MFILNIIKTIKYYKNRTYREISLKDILRARFIIYIIIKYISFLSENVSLQNSYVGLFIRIREKGKEKRYSSKSTEKK